MFHNRIIQKEDIFNYIVSGNPIRLNNLNDLILNFEELLESNKPIYLGKNIGGWHIVSFTMKYDTLIYSFSSIIFNKKESYPFPLSMFSAKSCRSLLDVAVPDDTSDINLAKDIKNLKLLYQE